MSIWVNEGGTHYELNEVWVNEGGAHYELNEVWSNEGGTHYEIHKKKSNITSAIITYSHGGGGSPGSSGGGGVSISNNNTIAHISSYASAAPDTATSQGSASGSCGWHTTTIPSGSTITITISKSSGTYSSAKGTISLTKIGESEPYQTIKSSTTVTLSNDAIIGGETSCSAEHGYKAEWKAEISITNANGIKLTFTANDLSS